MKKIVFFFVLIVQTITALEGRKIENKLNKLDWLIKNYLKIHEKREEITKRQDCIRLPFEQLMALYTAQADYNPTYLAATNTEAMLMPNLLWNSQDIKNYEYVIQNISKEFDIKNQKPEVASKVRTLVAQKLNLPLKVLAQNLTGIKRGIVTTESRFCKESGDTDYSTHGAYLCSSCSVTTSIDEGRFPKFLNEVVCQNGTACLKNEGRCKQNKIYIGMLYRQKDCQPVNYTDGQTILMEKWIYHRTPIRISCECQVSTDSFVYRNFVQKPKTTTAPKKTKT